MKARLALMLAGALLVPVLPMLAHHSFDAEYDRNKKVTISGTVTKLEWMNPHIWIYVDAKDEQGNVTRWQCEGGPPNSLSRSGWTRNAVKPGDQVTIDGFLAKAKANTCNSQNVRLPDGRRVFAGSAEGPAQEKN